MENLKCIQSQTKSYSKTAAAWQSLLEHCFILGDCNSNLGEREIFSSFIDLAILKGVNVGNIVC
jgi:hypothetical protein